MPETRPVPTAGRSDVVCACLLLLLADRPAHEAELEESLAALGLVGGRERVGDALDGLRRSGLVEHGGEAANAPAVRLTDAGRDQVGPAVERLHGTVGILQRFLERYREDRRRMPERPRGAAAGTPGSSHARADRRV